jgi:hypothetical protein
LPSLRALCLYCNFNMLDPPDVLFRSLSETCTHLTSLNIGHFMPPSEPLSLPLLKILIFHFEQGPLPLRHSFSGWSLPRLLMLGLIFDNLVYPTDVNLNMFCPITKGIKALFVFTFTRPGYIVNFPIDLEGTFPSLEFLFLNTTPLHLSRPIPPQHPLQFIKFSSSHQYPIFSSSVLPPAEHKRHQLVKLYLQNDQNLLEIPEFMDTFMHAGMEALIWDGKHRTQ